MSTQLFCLLSTLMLTAPGPEEVKLQAEINAPPQGIKVGTVFHLIIEAKHKAGGLALIPESLPLPDSIAERLEQRRHLRSKAQDTETDRYEIELIAFEVGDFELPPIEVAYGSTVAATLALQISVQSDLSEQEQLIASSTLPQAIAELEKMAAPNPSTVDIMVEDFTLVYVVGGLIFALFSFVFLRWLIRKYRQAQKAQEAAAPPPPPRPAHEVALERLEALRTSTYLADKDFKTYFVELSEILRSYVGGRYDFDSVELTVFELIAHLRGMRTPGLDLALLEGMLNDADFVKFAKYLPTDVEAHSALNNSFELVERSARKEATSNAAA